MPTHFFRRICETYNATRYIKCNKPHIHVGEVDSDIILLTQILPLFFIHFFFFVFVSRSLHKTTTAVYQVTRPGHEHCDVTEGILLDITPLVVDGKKLVTLYDKDLTEGVNLLIGDWGFFFVM